MLKSSLPERSAKGDWPAARRGKNAPEVTMQGQANWRHRARHFEGKARGTRSQRLREQYAAIAALCLDVAAAHEGCRLYLAAIAANDDAGRGAPALVRERMP